VEVVIPLLFGNIELSQKKLFEASMNGPTPDVPIQDIFSLYRRSKTLMKMYQAFVPESVLFTSRLTILKYGTAGHSDSKSRLSLSHTCGSGWSTRKTRQRIGLTLLFPKTR